MSIDVIFIALIVGLQLYFFWETRGKTIKLKKLFPIPTELAILSERIQVEVPQEEEEVDDTNLIEEDRSVNYYFRTPNLIGWFENDKKTTEQESVSIYKLTLPFEGANRGEVTIIDDQDIHQMAIRMHYIALNPVCAYDFSNFEPDSANGIEVIAPGIFTLEDNRWIAESKIKINMFLDTEEEYTYKSLHEKIQDTSDKIPFEPTKKYTSVDIEVLKLDNKWSSEFRKIVISSNQYLKNNRGATPDFDILKDISERVTGGFERSVSATLAIPLYIGLLGTMGGIIYGLSFINLDLDDSTAALSPLLTGVSTAMFGGFFGLAFTLISSSFLFRKAKYQNQARKNDYYTFLQTHLLPILENNTTSNLNKMAGQLAEFNRVFSLNINKIENVSTEISTTFANQKELYTLIKESGIQSIASANLRMFEKFQQSTGLIQQFVNLQNSVNQKMTSSVQYIDSTNKNMEKVNNTYKEIQGLRNDLVSIFENANQKIEASMQLVKFLERQYSSLESIGDNTKNLISTQEKIVRDTNEAFMSFLVEHQQFTKDKLKSVIAEAETNIKRALDDTTFMKLEQKVDAIHRQSKDNSKAISSTTKQISDVKKTIKSVKTQTDKIVEKPASNGILRKIKDYFVN